MKKYNGIIKIIGLLIIFPFAVWELTLKKTYALYRENKQMQTKVMTIGRGSRSSVPISATPPFLSNGKLLEKIANFLKEVNIEMVSYQPSLINEDNVYKLYSGTIVLRGEFINLVKIIDLIEREKLPAKLSSASFYYNPSKGKIGNMIELTLIFQQIEG